MGNDVLDMFIFENVQLTERLEEVLIEGENQGGFTENHISEIFRIMHTVKGSAAMMDFDGIANLGHRIEDMFFHIREHDDVKPDWEEIADICLNAVDFFKGEVAKIQESKPADGDAGALLARIAKCMEALAVSIPEGSVKEGPAAASGPAENAPGKSVPPEAGANVYSCRIFFEEGCKMENIRAYQLGIGLANYAFSVESVPRDLLEDCADEIIANGVLFTIRTDKSQEILREIVASALFVKEVEFEAISEAAAPEAAVSGDAPPQPPPAPKQEKEVTPVEKVEQTPAAPEEQSAPPEELAAPTEIKQNFISVNVDKLDKLMDLMGEIVISVSMVVNNPDLEGLELDNFEKSAAQLQKNTGELQDIIMSVRMLPISSTFHKMSRIVRDTSKKLGKEVELVLQGEETEIDKNSIDNLSDPLMHIIRNAMGHGIEESREARLEAGKPPVGRITLEARNSGSDVIISCTDDGRGLSREKILNKAKRNGLLSRPESDYSDKEAYQFVMMAGFSTSEQVTELSGRGVGMDVVKKNIEKVGGTVDLDSTPGKGMTVNIRIPLTLAILQCIEISVGKNNYLIPTLNIRESFKPDMEEIIVDPDGKEMYMFRGECFSVIRLHRIFGVETEIENFEDGIMIMIEDDDRMTAVFADQLVGEQQAVVKPIPNFITERIGQIYGISGCTLLGDGSISLIIDVKSLTQG